MQSLKEIAEMLKIAYDQGTYDPMVEATLRETLEYLENAHEDEDDYVDITEYGGCCGGHYADENMYEED